MTKKIADEINAISQNVTNEAFWGEFAKLLKPYSERYYLSGCNKRMQIDSVLFEMLKVVEVTWSRASPARFHRQVSTGFINFTSSIPGYFKGQDNIELFIPKIIKHFSEILPAFDYKLKDGVHIFPSLSILADYDDIFIYIDGHGLFESTNPILRLLAIHICRLRFDTPLHAQKKALYLLNGKQPEFLTLALVRFFAHIKNKTVTMDDLIGNAANLIKNFASNENADIRWFVALFFENNILFTRGFEDVIELLTKDEDDGVSSKAKDIAEKTRDMRRLDNSLGEQSHDTDEHVIKEIHWEGCRIRATRYGDDFFLMNETNKQSLSTSEINALFQTDPEYLARQFRRCGSPALGHLSRRVEEIRKLLPPNLNLVFLDTTTIDNACRCLGGDINPLNLLDLATLFHAVVTFDKIIVQPCAIPDSLSKFFHVLNYSDDFIQNELWPICANVSNQEKWLSSFEDDWTVFFNAGHEGIKLDESIWDSYQTSPLFWNGEFVDKYTSFVFEKSLGFSRSKELEIYLSITTARTLFNDRLASLLGLPYLASSFRSPVQARIVKAKHNAINILDGIIGELIKTDEANDATGFSGIVHLNLPFALGIAANRVNELTNLVPELLILRDEMSPLRDFISKSKEDWDGKELYWAKANYFDLLKNQIPKSLKTGGESVEITMAYALKQATTTNLDIGLLGLALKLFKLVKPAEKLYSMYMKHYRPDIYQLRNFSQEIQQLRRIEHHIRKLWHKNWTHRESMKLEQLAQLNPCKPLHLIELK